MNNFSIRKDHLETSIQLFQTGSAVELSKIAFKFNQEQPNFAQVLLSFELNGLDRAIIDDLLESVFVIYYAHAQLNKRNIPPVLMDDLFRNVKGFKEFIQYYNQERNELTAYLSQIIFLRDDLVLNYAIETLHQVFNHVEHIPNEVIFGYLGLLKCIELGAENQSNS